MKSLPKTIFYLIAVAVLCCAVKLYLAQAELDDENVEGKYAWYYKLELVGDIMLSIASVLSFILYRKFFPVYISVCWILLVIFVAICSINDLSFFVKRPSHFYSIRGIGTFINIGIIFFAANTVYLNKLLMLFYYLCYAFIIGGIINLGQTGIGSTRLQYLGAIKDVTVYLIWVFPFFFLQDEPDKKKNIINLGIYAILFVFILSTQARTYLIIYAIYLVVKFREQLRSKNSLLVIIGGAILVAGFFLLISSSSLGKTVDDAFQSLSERSSEDSRSGQIIEFVKQWDTENLMQGVGPVKQWYWTMVGDYYFGLDNQFLLLGWFAGLPALFTYIYFVVKIYYTKSEALLFEKIKGIKLMVALWILACLGFAIYISISSSLYYNFLTLLMGIYVCKYTLLKPAEDELSAEII